MKVRTALRIVEWTSLPLLFLAGVMVLSGYGLTSESARTASLGLLTFSSSQTLHLSRFVKLSFTSLLLLHTYAGTEVLAEKLRARGRERLAMLIEYSVIAFLVYVAWVVLNGEFGG
jgi:hypothetical protein